jgi:hypothetical protein
VEFFFFCFRKRERASVPPRPLVVFVVERERVFFLLRVEFFPSALFFPHVQILETNQNNKHEI